MTEEPTPNGGGSHQRARPLQADADRRALFAEYWPLAASRVRRMLLAVGADVHTADELVQETAFRVWRSGAPFDSSADLAAYARTVALNLRITLFRRSARVSHEELPVVAAADDVAAVAEARMALERTLSKLAGMTENDRQAILYGLWGDPDECDGAGYNRWKMRRSRARERLRALVEGATAVGGFARRARRWLEVEVGPVMAAAVAVATCLLPAVSALIPTRPTPPSVPASAPRPMHLATAATAPSVPVPATSVSASHVRAGSASGDRTGSAHGDRPVSADRPAPMLATPTGTDDITGTGTVTPYEGDELLRVCTKDDPLLGTGCPVSVNRPDVLRRRSHGSGG